MKHNHCKNCKYINQYNDHLRKRSNWVEHPRFSDLADEGDNYNCDNCKYNKDVDEILKIKDNQLKDKLENGISDPNELKQLLNSLQKNCMLLCIPFKLSEHFTKREISIIKKYKLYK